MRGAPGNRRPYRDESAAEALAVWDEEELGERLRDRRCGCGAALPVAPAERRLVRYDARLLTLVSRRCASCGGEQSLYVDLKGR